jgi:hypothetical protein
LDFLLSFCEVKTFGLGDAIKAARHVSRFFWDEFVMSGFGDANGVFLGRAATILGSRKC